MENNKKKAEKTYFDFKKFLLVCLKSWPMYLICVLGLAILAGIVILVRQPKYEVDAQLMLPQETSMGGLKVDMAASFNISDMIGGSSTTDNEIAVIQSHNVFLNTAKDLDLNVTYFEKNNFLKWDQVHTKAPLSISTVALMPDTLRQLLIFTLEKANNGTFDVDVKIKRNKIYAQTGITLPATLDTPYGPFTIEKTANYDKSKAYKFRILYSSYDAAAENYVKKVLVFAPSKKTDFIALNYVTPDPKFGQELLNTIIKNYNRVGINNRNERNYETLDFVDKRLSTLKDEMAISENQIEQFKKTHQITVPEYDANIILEKSAQLEMAQIRAEMENQVIRNTRAFLTNPANKYSLIPDLPNASQSSNNTPTSSNDNIGSTSSVITDAVKELNTYNMLVLERMKIQEGAKEGNSSLKLIDSQLDALRQTVLNSIDRALDNSNVTLNKIKMENAQVQARINSLPSLEKEYISMQRMMQVQEQLYLFLLKQREEASMNIQKDTAQIVVVDKPHTITESASLSPMILMLIAVFLGIAFPTAWVFLRSYSKAPYYSLDEIKASAKMPVLGTISDEEDSARRLRNEIQHLLRQIDGKRIAITSSMPDEGKSFTAIQIAQSLADSGMKTILIDAAFRNPVVDETFNVQGSIGLSDALASDSQVNINHCNTANGMPIDIVSAGTKASAAPDLLASKRFENIIETLSQAYDYIIIDSSAAQKYSDALTMGAIPDITIYVMRLKHTRPDNMEFANALYKDGRMQRMGLVVDVD